MSERICTACKKPIAEGSQTATGPDGDTHYRCFKVGTAHGREVDTSNGVLYIEIEHLKEEVRYLSRRVDDLERNPAVMRIGGRHD